MDRRTFIRTSTSAAALFALTACSNKFRVYTGPPVTSIIVQKARRRMFLMNENTALQRYDFELGFEPVGHKRAEGDGRTPEGAYYIDRKNPNSMFHLSIGISYPNAVDRAKARAAGQSPGGDIFIHGTPDHFASESDWTWGCIAVTNRQMEDIYAMVNVGTPIYIYP
ncbi:MAG: L,D-transpeptidase family protein [Pseudomonadota bacterium]